MRGRGDALGSKHHCTLPSAVWRGRGRMEEGERGEENDGDERGRREERERGRRGRREGNHKIAHKPS